MDNMQDILTLAESLWEYIEPKVDKKISRTVSYYRAEVTAAAANGKITVKKPFDDTPLALPYVSSAANLQVGQQATVLVLGTEANSVIISDGSLSTL